MVIKKILLACIAMLMILSITVSVFAGPVPDLDRMGSITVKFIKNGQPVSGGSIICTRVGYIHKDGSSYSFKRRLDNQDILNLQDPDTAALLEKFVKQNNISGIVKNVGKDGKVVFQDLETGVYLIRQKDAAEGYLPIRPFLVTLPYLKDGAYIYDVDASAKTELDKEPTESTEPSSDPTEPSSDPTEPSSDPTEPSSDPTEPSSDPTEPSSDSSKPTDPTEPSDGGGDAPQTGQLNWPIPVMAMVGLFCLFAGLILVSKHKKETQ